MIQKMNKNYICSLNICGLITIKTKIYSIHWNLVSVMFLFYLIFMNKLTNV